MRIRFPILILVLAATLITGRNAYPGVTADGTTAYRHSGVPGFIVFTDNPADDPDGDLAPLGAGLETGDRCNATGTGNAGVTGLLCSGTLGDSVDAYTCASVLGAQHPGSTFWCLFSENPRIGNKAWAIKYVDGLIPTNDETSIVRCQGTDIFDPVAGCRLPPPEISVEDGFIKLETTEGATPLGINCSVPSQYGRMLIDNVNDLLYICSDTGWKSR